MYSNPVLALANFTKTCILECDASEKGNGVVLMQDGMPLAFTIKQVSKRHLGQSIYENKMLAIMHVVDLWCPYLLGNASKLKLIIRVSIIFRKNELNIIREKKLGDQAIWILL
jgi:hypothetical protein